jgi:hypothetical protein
VTLGAGVITSAASYLGPVTVGAHHVVQSVYFFFCMCGDAVSQAAQSFLPGLVRATVLMRITSTLQCFGGLHFFSELLMFLNGAEAVPKGSFPAVSDQFSCCAGIEASALSS